MSALAPRVSPAAVRVPDPRHLELPIVFPPGWPQLFVHEGARQALERKLAQAFGKPVLLSVTDNRRAMISHAAKNGVVQTRLHHMFLNAPSAVQDALIKYLLDQDRDASQVVSQYIEENGHRIRAHQAVSRPLKTDGKVHDLLAIFRSLNDKYFGNGVDALITWGRKGRAPKGGPRKAIKLGSYSAVERLIRVNPVLDKPWIPRYFVSYIIYHEMLHHVIPQSQGGGRRMLHPPVFQARERLFRDYERAIAWERQHVGRLLKS